MSVVLENSGMCPICERNTTFRSNDPWLRENYVCTGGCNSLPRERALMAVIQQIYPDWRSLDIHESTPLGRSLSVKLAQQCAGYVATQYDPRCESGTKHPTGFTCEDLENQNFANNRFDLVITQDLMKHVLDPDAAFREIARTLRPGGAHIFTVPLTKGLSPSQVRVARGKGNELIHYVPPEFHGDPNGPRPALVTVDWGLDIVRYISEAGGLISTIFQIDRIDWGIRAELNQVIVSQKLLQ